MKKSIRLFVFGVVAQTVGIVGFPIVAGSSMGGTAKPILLLLVAGSLLSLLYQIVQQLKFAQALLLTIGFAIAAVSAHQLLGFLVYPGLVKDIEWMSPEHAWLTLIVFATVVVSYLAGYGLLRLVVRLLGRRQLVARRAD